jgi:hypothetical protein
MLAAARKAARWVDLSWRGNLAGAASYFVQVLVAEMQVSPQSFPVLHCFAGAAMWQVLSLAMQLSPQGFPVVQLGAAMAIDDALTASTTASSAALRICLMTNLQD